MANVIKLTKSNVDPNRGITSVAPLSFRYALCFAKGKAVCKEDKLGFFVIFIFAPGSTSPLKWLRSG